MIEYFIIALASLGIGFFCRNAIEKAKSLTTYQSFEEQQRQIFLDLKEKEQSYQKEFQDKFADLIQKNEMLEDLHREAQENYNIEIEKLEKDLKLKEQKFQELELKKIEELEKKNSEVIISKQNELTEEINRIEETNIQKKNEIEKNFQLWKEKIDSEKATLSNEIKAFEDTIKSINSHLIEEEKVKEQQQFYKITIPQTKIEDIKRLKKYSQDFNDKTVIHKLIYEHYYKAKIEETFKRILGENKNSGGIYKITNINSNKAYIGKTSNLFERWKTHAKRGCGIERISSLLYDSLFEEGLENFTWEIVELCGKEKQTEREKFWIKTLQTDIYGYNMKVG